MVLPKMSLFLFVLTLAALNLVEGANKTETFAPSHAVTGVTIFSVNSDVKVFAYITIILIIIDS